MLGSLLITLIRLYQATLSKVILALAGPVCRFQPSCSRYAIACIEGHGPLRGSLLSIKRLCRCHPLHPGGHDPPPPPRRPTALRAGGASAEPPRADTAPHDEPRSSAPPDDRLPFTSAAAKTTAPASATSTATAHAAPDGAGR